MSEPWMIEVQDLTKRYGSRVAIHGVSFQVARGEIVGLLGPNGAGKSTTMRILAGFLPATFGTARVAGYDVALDSLEVRRRIGYMPENNPLYPEMRVQEYLRFRARLKGLSRRRARERVEVVLEQCGLTEVRRRLIGQLSKGYRQRVGLADALVHEPDLIVLDEPTIGLDPHQIRSVRRLIKGLAGRHTVLLSTHILPEAEMTCHRMLILLEGRVLASGTPAELERRLSGSRQVLAEIAAPEEGLRSFWNACPEVAAWEMAPADDGFHRCLLMPRGDQDLRPQVYAWVREQGWTLRELSCRRYSLEDIYVRLTGQEGGGASDEDEED
ncbi:MAG: ABC transporter ATP-binding protein [Verrucomicrobiota bacterium]|nr:ABC transporter ATP-binding protein [Limisphaera sp.]MDW8382662.1 ABC transporter ATP-binding protein [Verrucomicrobiota bacterium]